MECRFIAQMNHRILPMTIRVSTAGRNPDDNTRIDPGILGGARANRPFSPCVPLLDVTLMHQLQRGLFERIDETNCGSSA